MTIITKPISEKKENKLILPLVENQQQPSAPEDVEAQNPRQYNPAKIRIIHSQARSVSRLTTLCILFLSFCVLGLGIIGGSYMYRQYFRSTIYKGWCNVPYEPLSQQSALIDDSPSSFERNDRKVIDDLVDYFQEQFELDVDNEEYEKIDVPDFRNGRQGRFIHDFNTNKTGIIDITDNRCFVMPMNRDTVLPPKTLYDMLQKMWDGYYNVDTKVIRETMEVDTTPIANKLEVGSYIAKECANMPIYRLKKANNKVYKRSVDLKEPLRFASFSGKGIFEIDILNLDSLEGPRAEN